MEWGTSLIEVRTAEDIEAEVHLKDFTHNVMAGRYGQAMQAYPQLSAEQQAQYAPWLDEIKKRQQIASLRQHLLQHLVKRG